MKSMLKVFLFGSMLIPSLSSLSAEVTVHRAYCDSNKTEVPNTIRCTCSYSCKKFGGLYTGTCTQHESGGAGVSKYASLCMVTERRRFNDSNQVGTCKFKFEQFNMCKLK